MNVGEHFVNLIVVWNNSKEQKIVRYELHISKCCSMDKYTIQVGPKTGEVIDWPKVETVISGLKITKTKAKELIAKGYKVAAGYSDSGA